MLFREFSKDAVSIVVEQFVRQPGSAVMGVPWYKGTALANKPYHLLACIKKDKKTQHGPFLFSYIVAALWDMGGVLGI